MVKGVKWVELTNLLLAESPIAWRDICGSDTINLTGTVSLSLFVWNIFLLVLLSPWSSSTLKLSEHCYPHRKRRYRRSISFRMAHHLHLRSNGASFGSQSYPWNRSNIRDRHWDTGQNWPKGPSRCYKFGLSHWGGLWNRRWFLFFCGGHLRRSGLKTGWICMKVRHIRWDCMFFFVILSASLVGIAVERSIVGIWCCSFDWLTVRKQCSWACRSALKKLGGFVDRLVACSQVG